MATLRNKRKLAVVTREIDEEHPKNGQSRNTSVSRINKEYITKVSEEIEGRVTKKLYQEFSRTESRISGALSKLDEFLLNQEIRMHSGTVPETFRNTNVDNQGTKRTTPRVILILKRPLPQPDYTKLWPRSWSLHGDRSYRRDSQWSRHSDKSWEREPMQPWHGDRCYKRSSQWPCHGSRRSRRDSLSSSHGDRSSRRSLSVFPHGDRNSGRGSLLLAWNFLRKTKEGSLHKSATILQWEHPCDNWSRPGFVDPSTTGDEQ